MKQGTNRVEPNGNGYSHKDPTINQIHSLKGYEANSEGSPWPMQTVYRYAVALVPACVLAPTQALTVKQTVMLGFSMQGLSETGGSAELRRPLSTEELRPLLDRILKSRHFASAGRKKKFLQVVFEYYLRGRADELTEFLLACEVFGHDQNYNPAEDPSVRVCAHDVRKRLKAYFENEGAEETLIVQIPPGAYRPLFLERVRGVSSSTPATGVSDPNRHHLLVWAISIGAVLSIAGAATFLGSLRSASPPLRSVFWKPFMEGSTPVLVVLSNPPLFQFLYNSDPVQSKQDLVPLSPEAMAAIEKRLGSNANRMPYLVLSPQDYTGMGEAMSLPLLTRFFDRYSKNMIVKQSRTTGTEDLKDHNAVVVGGPLSNDLMRDSAPLDFDLSGNYVLNRKPLSGEQPEYRLGADPISGQPITDWAVISVVPGLGPGRTIMMLAGIRGEGCQAAVEYVTNDQYAEQLQRRLNPNAPVYFQALLRVDVKDRVPANISLVAVHPLSGK
jgi:hypothetical protein